jgi:hypothetical protein
MIATLKFLCLDTKSKKEEKKKKKDSTKSQYLTSENSSPIIEENKCMYSLSLTLICSLTRQRVKMRRGKQTHSFSVFFTLNTYTHLLVVVLTFIWFEVPQILLIGAEPPKITDLILIQWPLTLLRAIFLILKFILYKILRKEMDTVDFDEIQRQKLRMTKEEYEQEKRKALEV